MKEKSGSMKKSITKKYRPYPTYKDSGVEWLGEIPEGWDVKPNSRIFRERNERGRSDLPILEVSISSGVSIREFSQDRIEQRSDNLELYKVARSGDIAFNKMRMWQGAVGCVPEDGLVSPDYIVACPISGQNGIYYAHLFRTRVYMDEVYRRSHGIVDDRNRLYWDDFKAIYSPVLSRDIEKKIISFLDRQTAKIDALLAKYSRLLELLAEKRSALISRAVTKGLDSDAPMRDSGVEWLGEMPSSWSLPAIGYSYSVQLGKMLDTSQIVGTSLFPYLRNTDVQWDAINIDDLPLMDFSEEEKDKFSLMPGDLLVCEGGDIGRSAIWKGELKDCYFQKAIHRLRPINSEIDNPRFLFYFLKNANNTGILLIGQDKATIAHFTAEMVRAQRYPSPPLKDQDKIVKFLDSESNAIDALVAKVERAIELLKERRVALISAAVTGKIDLREESA
jgi:type I restriction enzyme, S subunit